MHKIESLAAASMVTSGTPEHELLSHQVAVEVASDGDDTYYYATWPTLDLDGVLLYKLLDIASPQPGTEPADAVITNYRGIHEDDNRDIIEVHRQLFGEKWIDMAHSRRLLWTVLSRDAFQYLSHDDSIHRYWNHTHTVSELGEQNVVESLAAASMIASMSYPQTSPYEEDTELLEKMAPVIEKFKSHLPPPKLWQDDHDFYNVWVDAVKDREVHKLVTDTYSKTLADMTEEEKRLVLDELFNTFVDDQGRTHYVAIRVKPEEGISLQAMYHQRVPVKYANEHPERKGWRVGRFMETWSGSDHTNFTEIRGATATVPTEYKPDRAGAHYVKPVLAWRVAADGARSHVRNEHLPEHLRTIDGAEKGIAYTDTTTGLVMAALALPGVRSKWPTTSRLPKGTLADHSERNYVLTPGEREIPMGAAQTPLLSLLSAEAIYGTALIRRLEVAAEAM